MSYTNFINGVTAFSVSGPCPRCKQEKLFGYNFTNEENGMMHTHYVCTFWATPKDRSVYRDPDYNAEQDRCGWHGWSLHGHETLVEEEKSMVIENRIDTRYDKNNDEAAAELNAVVEELTEALRLTVEYMGVKNLPPIDGWTWYDAMRKYAPHKADKLLEVWESAANVATTVVINNYTGLHNP